MTTMPLARMAATLVMNSTKAARDWRGAPDSRVSPTTARGGTREMAMATTGTGSGKSERARAYVSPAPGARAATRSTIRGVTRAATWLLVGRHDRVGDEQAHQPADPHHGGCAGPHPQDAPAPV